MIKTILKILIVYTISLATMSWGEVQAFTWESTTTADCYNESNTSADGNIIITAKNSSDYTKTYYLRRSGVGTLILVNPSPCSYTVNPYDTLTNELFFYNSLNGFIVSQKNINSNIFSFSVLDKNINNVTITSSNFSANNSSNFYDKNGIVYSSNGYVTINNPSTPYINNIYSGDNLTYTSTATFSAEDLHLDNNQYISPSGDFYSFDTSNIYIRSKNNKSVKTPIVALSSYSSFAGYNAKILVNSSFIVVSGYEISDPYNYRTLICKISDYSCTINETIYIYDLTIYGFLSINESDGITHPLRTYINTENNIKYFYAYRSNSWYRTIVSSSDFINSSFTNNNSSSSSSGGSGSLFDLTIFSDFFSGFTTWLDDFIGFFTGFSDHFFDNEFYGTGITEFTYTGLVSFSSLEEGRSLTAPIYTANSPIFSIIQTNQKYYHNENIFNYYFNNSRVNDKSEFSMYNEAVNHTYFFYKKFNYLNNSGFYNGKILTFNKNFFENFNFLPFYLKIFSIEISNGINTAIYYLLYILVGFLYLIFEFVNFFGQFFYIIPLEVGQCYNYLGQSLCFNDFSGGNRLNTVNYYSGGDLLFFVIIILFLTKILKKFFKY